MPGLVIRHFKKFIGQTFSLVVKFPVRMLFASMLKYLGLVPSSASSSRFMLLHTQNTAGSGSSSWVPSTHARDVDWVLASRFSTAQPRLLWAFGEWSSGREQSVVTVFFLLSTDLLPFPSLLPLSILSCPASSFLPFKKRVVKDLTCINVRNKIRYRSKLVGFYIKTCDRSKHLVGWWSLSELDRFLSAVANCAVVIQRQHVCQRCLSKKAFRSA